MYHNTILVNIYQTVRATQQRMLFTTWGTQRGHLVCILPVWLGNIIFFRVINIQSKRRTKSGRVINVFVMNILIKLLILKLHTFATTGYCTPSTYVIPVVDRQLSFLNVQQ
jgi:hypothetical protein